ncbi:hypothetical protein PIB30_079084 [Stylosanthes scabra]|uniref:Uncharacterized protein n=1 Tax=Stylosanthes scabra TaxID=79078 RepID=A0ABU6VQ74_9FABA|nr:hypothetical protein [Stylosanthes scabra]
MRRSTKEVSKIGEKLIHERKSDKVSRVKKDAESQATVLKTNSKGIQVAESKFEIATTMAFMSWVACITKSELSLRREGILWLLWINLQSKGFYGYGSIYKERDTRKTEMIATKVNDMKGSGENNEAHNG